MENSKEKVTSKSTKKTVKTKFKKGDLVVYTGATFEVVESLQTQFGEVVKLYGRVGYVDIDLIKKA